MQRTIQACLYSTDPQTGEHILESLAQMTRVEVVAAVGSWDALRERLNNANLDLVIANLDPNYEEALKVVQQASRMAPEVGLLGVSTQTDPKVIINAMRLGCTQFVCAPIDQPDLETAIQRIEATRVSVVPASKRVCVIGSAGGVGATAIACNLAIELTSLSERPAGLVDLNLDFGDAAATFDVAPKYTVVDICKGDTDLDRTMVEAAMHELPCNVHVLARPHRLEDAHLVTPEGIGRVLELLSNMYPYVVVDLPRACTTGNATAIERADHVLVIAQLSVASIRNAHRMVESLLQMGAEEDKLEVVINRYKADHQRIRVADVEESFGRPVFATIPNDYRCVAAALDLGHPIMTNAPQSPARVAIYEMARKIAQGGPDQEDTSSPERKSILGRLWGKREVSN